MALDSAAMLSMSLDDIVSNTGFGPSEGKGKRKGRRSAPYEGGDSAPGGDGRRVYVGNLPYSATWQDLKDHMRAAGNVLHCDIIGQPGTAMGSKGCGIVEYASAAEAKKAIADLQDTEINGRAIFVREDREPGDFTVRRKGEGKGKGKSGGNGSGGNPNVFVGNLAYSVTWQDLKDHMRAAGNVLHCDIMKEPGTAMGSKGCGLVQYSSGAEARTAIRKLTETTIKGRAIFVREDREADFEPPRRRGYDDGPRRDRGDGGRGCTVFVGNLPYSATWQDLKDHMRKAGDVLHCDIIAEPGTTMGSKGCGLVEFAHPRDAKRAIRDLTDTMLRGRPIWVREDREGGR